MTRPIYSRSSIEPLESRRLLAGFQLNIDFHPESGETAPGYLRDVGWAYTTRPSGYAFGWDRDNRANAIERNVLPNKRVDTFNQLLPDGRWDAAVPDGTYQVRLLVGDITDTRGRYIVDVEGVRVIDDLPREGRPFIDRIATVEVSDGKLTLTSGLGSGVDKLASIEITQLTAAPSQTMGIDWSSKGAAPAATRRIEPGTVQIGDKLYVIGGYSSGNSDVTRSVEVLDLPTQTWTELSPIPDGAAESHAGIASDGQRFIYWVAGQTGPRDSAATSSAWRYDTVNDSWDRFVDLPEARYAGGLAFFNNVLYFFGGNDTSRTDATTSHWAISTRSKNPTWIERAPLPAANDHLGVAVVDGTIYAIGGEDGHGTTYVQHKNVFAFNPWTNAWTQKADLPTASSHFEGGTHVIGDKILVLGGRIDIAAGTWTDEVRVYDTLADKWTVIDSLPDARLGPSSAVYHGRVYFTNGYSGTFGMTDRSYWGLLHGF